MNILAIIPARSGSKSVRNKNIRLIGGKPLLAFSVEHAVQAETVNRVIISTDSIRYGNIAKKYGSEFLFKRPAEFAQDQSTDLEVFTHALAWLKDKEGYVPEIVVHLRPTYPVRDPGDIDKMVKILIDDPSVDSVRSIALSPETPYKMWFREENGIIRPVIKSGIREAYNQPRQYLPVTFLQNACIDVIRGTTLTEKNSMTGDRIYGYIMDHNWDIDYIHQLKKVRNLNPDQKKA